MLHFRLDTAGVEIKNGVDEVAYHAGAAIRTEALSLRLENVDIHHCRPLGDFTTVIESRGGLFLRNSRVHHNGGPSHVAAGIVARGANPSVTLVQSTIDNNSDDGLSIQGGTLVVHSSTISANSGFGMSVAETTATISNSTFVGNGANQLRIANLNYPDESFSTLLTGSLFQSGSDCFIHESAGSIVVDSVGNTFSGDGCDHDNGLDDKNLTHASIAVSPLGFWGGLTPTHKLLPGSDGIDRVDVPLYVCDSPGVDQRDLPRPVSSDGSPMPYCDSGAVELQPEEQPPQEPPPDDPPPQDPPSGPIFSDGFES